MPHPEFMRKPLLLGTLLTLILLASPVHAEFYSYSKYKTVIGFSITYVVEGNESLIEIARKFGLGYNEITAANPQLDPFIPGSGNQVKIPTSWVLPEAESFDGIIINLTEMRLYYFFHQQGSQLARTFPIGIGSEGNDTPEGVFSIVEKTENPSWYPPESIRKENPELPKVFPPGPDNPLGTHAMRLSRRTILIHGTHRPFGIGRQVSHGCIRLYPEHIPKLFKVIPVKTKVTIIRQPVKVGVVDNQVYLEVHKDHTLTLNYFDAAAGLLKKKNLYDSINKEKMIMALREKKGYPVNISGE